MSDPFSIPPDARARMSMLSQLHNGSKTVFSETGSTDLPDPEDINMNRTSGANRNGANERPAGSYEESAKTAR